MVTNKIVYNVMKPEDNKKCRPKNADGPKMAVCKLNDVFTFPFKAHHHHHHVLYSIQSDAH